MKVIIFTAFLFLQAALPVLADWSDDFALTYQEKGIDEAVRMALSEGANPDQIIKAALPLQGLDDQLLIKALFCALAQPDAIRDAARANAIRDETVEEGYQLALTECKREMDENLNSAILQNRNYPELAPAKSERRTVYGSPWKFD